MKNIKKVYISKLWVFQNSPISGFIHGRFEYSSNNKNPLSIVIFFSFTCIVVDVFVLVIATCILLPLFNSLFMIVKLTISLP
jgi:hypothetical protein